MRDPHVIVNGRGLRRLRAAGLRVDLGVCGAEVRAALAGYRQVHLAGRPRVVWKLGTTLDGRIADFRGRSRWITGPAARRAAHRMRARADAIVIGAGTARADDPRLTARGPGTGDGVRSRRVQPLRVVCDTRLRLPRRLRLFGPLALGTVVACARRAVGAGRGRMRRRELEARGVAVWPLAGGGRGVAPHALARRLAAEGCADVLLECGARLGDAWLEAGLVDELALFVAPRVLCGGAQAWSGALPARRLEEALGGRLIEVRRLGRDVLLRVAVER
jgi:diaminohydroxyphosphoribosylaminopyrimidine deaminase/5-amino-6-(5-phosphoribosylamino)uracil reductase